MQDMIFQSQADYFKALSHPARLKILHLLRDGEKCVCEIVPLLGMEQSNVSRHLAIMRKEGILSSQKKGLKVTYSTTNKTIYELIDMSKTIMVSHLEKKRATILKL